MHPHPPPHAKNMPICKQYAKNRHKICIICKKNMQKICRKYAENMQKICNLWRVHKLHKYAKICTRNFADVGGETTGGRPQASATAGCPRRPEARTPGAAQAAAADRSRRRWPTGGCRMPPAEDRQWPLPLDRRCRRWLFACGRSPAATAAGDGGSADSGSSTGSGCGPPAAAMAGPEPGPEATAGGRRPPAADHSSRLARRRLTVGDDDGLRRRPATVEALTPGAAQKADRRQRR